MGSHLIDGQFQSDKYPTTPRGKVPLSVGDVTAQDLLWEYAQRRRSVDAEFADDLETALQAAGYAPEQPIVEYVQAAGADLVAFISPIMQEDRAITYVGLEPYPRGYCVWIGIEPDRWRWVRKLIDLLPFAFGEFACWEGFGERAGQFGYLVPIDGSGMNRLAIGFREQAHASASSDPAIASPSDDPSAAPPSGP